MSASPGARVLAALGAAGVAALFVVLQPLALAEVGCPGTGAAIALAALPFVVFLALLAAAPATLQRLLARWTAVDLSQAAHVAAAVTMGGALFVVLGLGAAAGAAGALEHVWGACTLGAPATITSEAIVTGVLINFALFTIPALLYVGLVHGLGPVGTLRAVGIREEGWARALAIGAVVALGFLVVLALLLAAVSPFLPEELLQNDQALEIARSVTLPAALVLATGAGIGEEIFFRGFLQPRIGNVWTSVIFAVAHANYGSVSEVVIVFLLSLALGYLYERTGNLLAPISAHFTFNLVQLLIGMYALDGVGT